uniref:Uncharacterized protein n=1 Tax=Anopheles dirus TaxID=7168 RepID=A0A182NLC7_9DIPT
MNQFRSSETAGPLARGVAIVSAVTASSVFNSKTVGVPCSATRSWQVDARVTYVCSLDEEG